MKGAEPKESGQWREGRGEWSLSGFGADGK